MPSIISLATRLETDFPAYQFVGDAEFRWSPRERTIFFDKTSSDQASLLHELSHALLGHEIYTKDIHLIEMERDAWRYAQKTLAPRYKITVNDDTIQDALDTYRDWLHARSTCPECTATGIQIKQHVYKCVICESRWKVNNAHICALRRHKIRDPT